MKRAFSYVTLTWHMVVSSIRSQWEYRTSFLIQVVGMMLNDFLLVVIWIFFFTRFNELNGWTFQDTQQLLSMHILMFSFVLFAFGGVLTITKEIAEGTMDVYLSRPRSVLWQALVGKNRIDVLGDFFFGLGMTIYVSITQGWSNFIYIVSAALISSVGFLMVAVVAQSIGFWVKRFEKASVHYFWTVEAPAFYPQNTLTGGLRIFLLTVVPSIWIISIPFTFVNEHAIVPLILMVCFSAVVSLIAVTIFRNGLKKYESGNLVRVNN